MSVHAHPMGHCTCVTHSKRPWNRSEHWTADEVEYLEGRFGRASDEAIARHLGRPVLGVRLKAKRLGIRKRDAGLSATEVARLLAVDATTVTKVWIRKGLLRTRRGYAQGPARKGTHWYVRADEVSKLPVRDPEAVDYTQFLRTQTLQRRRDRRKGIAA